MNKTKSHEKSSFRIQRSKPSRPVRKRRVTPPIDAEHRLYWVRHKHALRVLSNDAVTADWRSAYTHSGCVGAIIAAIEAGNHSRSDILHAAKATHPCSYSHVGYILGQLCGPDPRQHIWYQDAERGYQLHHFLASDQKIAA